MVVALAGTLGATLLSGDTAPAVQKPFTEQQQRSVEQQQRAAEQQQRTAAGALIAKRYSCDLIGVTDLHTAPDPRSFSLDKSYPRDHVQVQLKLALNKDAAAPMAKYDVDDTVFWHPPTVATFVASADQQGFVRGINVNSESEEPFYKHDEPKKVLTPTADIFPRTSTPDGLAVEIYAHNNLTVDNVDGTTTQMDGYVPCGTMVKAESEWVAAPNAAAVPFTNIQLLKPN
jgi:hypothetical protein